MKDNAPSYNTIVVGLLLMAAVMCAFVAVASCVTGCKHAGDAVALAASAHEAGAPFDQAMDDCETTAAALDAGACAKCAAYNECQRRVAREHGLPSELGACVGCP